MTNTTTSDLNGPSTSNTDVFSVRPPELDGTIVKTHIFDAKRDEVVNKAEKTQKKTDIPEELLSILQPFLVIYTEKIKEQITMTLEPGKRIPKHLKKKLKKANGEIIQTTNKTHISFIQALAHVRRILEERAIFAVLEKIYPLDMLKDLPLALLREYYTLYKGREKDVHSLATDTHTYIQTVIIEHIKRTTAGKRFNIHDIGKYNNHIKELYMNSCFPSEQRKYPLFPVHIENMLNGAIRKQKLHRNVRLKLEGTCWGMLAELQGKYMMEHLGENSNNSMQASAVEFPLDKALELDIHYSIDALFEVVGPDGQKYVYCIDFKNTDKKGDIIFGDDNIVELYRSDARMKQSSFRANGVGEKIRTRVEKIKKMLTGVHTILGISKETPIRILAIKVGIDKDTHFTPEQLSLKSKAFLNEFLKNQFPKYVSTTQ